MNYAVLTRQINDTVLTRQIIFAWKNAIFNPMNYVVLTRGLFYVLLTRDIQSKKLRRVNTGGGYYIELILRVIMQYAEFTRYIRSRNLHAVNARCELLGITVTHELNYAMVIRGIHSN